MVPVVLRPPGETVRVSAPCGWGHGAQAAIQFVYLTQRRWVEAKSYPRLTLLGQSLGSMILAASMVPFLLNVWITARTAPRVTVNDPWGYGGSLEWATSCPPPRHNFTSIPRIRSERPAFDLNHPEAGIPVGVGPAKDAPDAPVVELTNGEVK